MGEKPGPNMGNPAHSEVLSFVREHNDPAVSTSEVSKAFPEVSKRTIYNRLEDLRERDQIMKKRIEPKALVWYTKNYVSESPRASSPSSLSQ